MLKLSAMALAACRDRRATSPLPLPARPCFPPLPTLRMRPTTLPTPLAKVNLGPLGVVARRKVLEQRSGLTNTKWPLTFRRHPQHKTHSTQRIYVNPSVQFSKFDAQSTYVHIYSARVTSVKSRCR